MDLPHTQVDARKSKVDLPHTQVDVRHTPVSVKAIAFRQRQAQRMKEQQQSHNGSLIDLETVKTPPDSPRSSQWLSSREKKTLLNGRWLSDTLINAGQELIHQQFPHISELQDVALGHTLAFSVMYNEFVQVLHNGEGHWVTLSTIGCGDAHVDLYDSTYPVLTNALQRQIAALLHTDQNTITVRYVNRFPSIVCHKACLLHYMYTCRYMQCQQQTGAADCGLFSLAYAAVYWQPVDTQVLSSFSRV